MPSPRTVWCNFRVCFWRYLIGFTHDSIVWRYSWTVAESISNVFLCENASKNKLCHIIPEVGACIGCSTCSTVLKFEFYGLSDDDEAGACLATSPPADNTNSDNARINRDEARLVSLRFRCSFKRIWACPMSCELARFKRHISSLIEHLV